MIIQKVRHYDFSKVKWDSRSWGNEVFDPAFLFCFRAKPAELSGALVSHASGFALRIADKAHCGDDEKHLNRRVLNYLSCTAPDGSCRRLHGLLVGPPVHLPADLPPGPANRVDLFAKPFDTTVERLYLLREEFSGSPDSGFRHPS